MNRPTLDLAAFSETGRRSSWNFEALRRAAAETVLTRRFAILAAFVLSLPSIRLGLVADDIWHRAMLRGHSTLPFHGGPLSLFTFVSGDPADRARALEVGLLPWWSSSNARMAFFRPVSSLTHALDYALWPTSPAAMHVHSILWYLAGVALAGVLYRRLLGLVSPRAAAIATLFYAIDPTHGLPVGWIANRNALIATTFAFATLLVHDIGRERVLEKKPRAWLFPFATALALAFALGAGESGIAAVVYLAAHAVFLDERSIAARVRSLVPAAVVVGAWSVVYRLGNYGVVGSGIYRDPIHAPLGFLRGIATNGPLLLASELGLPPDSWPALPVAAKAAVLAVAVLLIVWAASVLRRAVFADDQPVRRVSRFLVAAGCIGVLPSTATFPCGRLLLIPGFALVGLIALLCAGALPGPASRGTRAFAGWCWFAHVVVAPFAFVAMLHSLSLVETTFVRPLADGVPSDASSAAKRLVLVNAPDTLITAFLVSDVEGRGGTPPERLLTLSGNRRDVRVTRTGAQTLSVHEDGGFARTGTELLFRDTHTPTPVGSTITLSDVSVTVEHTTPDGVPDEASFTFTKNLDDAYVFRKWEGSSLLTFSLPAIGESVAFAARTPTP